MVVEYVGGDSIYSSIGCRFEGGDAISIILFCAREDDLLLALLWRPSDLWRFFASDLYSVSRIGASSYPVVPDRARVTTGDGGCIARGLSEGMEALAMGDEATLCEDDGLSLGDTCVELDAED